MRGARPPSGAFYNRIMDFPRLSAACASLALHAAALTAVLAVVLTPPVLQAPQPLEVSLIAPPVPLPVARVPADAVPPAPARAAPPAAPPPPPRQAPAPRPPRPHLAAPAPAPAPRPTADEPPLRPPSREPVAETAPAPAAPAPAASRDGAASQPTAETPAPAGQPTGGLAAARTATQPAGPVRSGPHVDASWAGNTPPPYPGMARRMGEHGEVRLDVRVGADGRVTEIRLKQSSGSALLDRTAIDTVKKWRFNPATVDGRPVAEWYHDWRWVFRLEG